MAFRSGAQPAFRSPDDTRPTGPAGRLQPEDGLSALEQHANGIRSAINVLREAGGLPPRYPEGSGPGGVRGTGDDTLTQIGPDTFYGKKQSTAIHQYLGMRKAAGKGPATPREIFDVLKKGGLQFETKSDGVALVALRASTASVPQVTKSSRPRRRDRGLGSRVLAPTIGGVQGAPGKQLS